MSNVIPLIRPERSTPDLRQARLVAGFADQRRLPDDVFWLKENAEMLGILASMEIELAPDALAPFAQFYEQIEERLRFFPQYYRFLLSICLDLEDLGMKGDKSSALCHWVTHQGLVEAELSDLQRTEARRLMARRGADDQGENGLDGRLHRFINRSDTFVMPNKKAAYELTHIVFYLSEYGKCDPAVSQDAILSLEFAGLLAYLDQNMDLLAEICTSLRFAGRTPSPIWDQAVQAAHAGCVVLADADAGMNDPYHEYLVTGWAVHVAGADAFAAQVPQGALRFARPHIPAGALRTISERMFEMGATRSGDWHRMRGQVMPYLGQEGHGILESAEQSSAHFEAFFEGFARAGAV